MSWIQVIKDFIILGINNALLRKINLLLQVNCDWIFAEVCRIMRLVSVQLMIWGNQL